MDTQSIINSVLGFIGGVSSLLFAYFIRQIGDVHKDNMDLSSKISSLELLIAGQYVRREDFNYMVSAVMAKLDKIEDKIDKKADK